MGFYKIPQFQILLIFVLWYPADICGGRNRQTWRS